MKTDIAVSCEVENLYVNTKYKLKAGFHTNLFYFISILYLPFHTFFAQSALYAWSAYIPVPSLHFILSVHFIHDLQSAFCSDCIYNALEIFL